MHQKTDLPAAVRPLKAGSALAASALHSIGMCGCARASACSATLAAVFKKRWRYTAGLLF